MLATLLPLTLLVALSKTVMVYIVIRFLVAMAVVAVYTAIFVYSEYHLHHLRLRMAARVVRAAHHVCPGGWCGQLITCVLVVRAAHHVCPGGVGSSPRVSWWCG